MRHIILLVIILSMISLAYAEKVPDFRLPDQNNRDVTLQSILGKGPILIDFWASWCNPCKRAMPLINDLANAYDSLTVVFISLDAAKDIGKAKSFLQSKKFNAISLFDSDKVFAKKLNVNNVPHTFILNQEGEIVHSHVGFGPGTEKEYEAIIRNLLNLEPLDE